jgi:hypothetical protein
MPEVQQAPPNVATPQVQAAADAERQKTRAASGRAATMLSGDDEERSRPMTATKKLLGQ